MDDWQQILAWGQSSSPKEQKQQKKDTGKNVDGLEAVLPPKKKKKSHTRHGTYFQQILWNQWTFFSYSERRRQDFIWNCIEFKYWVLE